MVFFRQSAGGFWQMKVRSSCPGFLRTLEKQIREKSSIASSILMKLRVENGTINIENHLCDEAGLRFYRQQEEGG